MIIHSSDKEALKKLFGESNSHSKNKYKNKKVSYNDGKEIITFDSKLEMDRYLHLKVMEKAGKISNLQRQVRYQLVPDYVIDGKKVKGVSYVADFVYEDDKGNTVVEDTKGFRTKEFIIKKKLFEYNTGLKLVEVYTGV